MDKLLWAAIILLILLGIGGFLFNIFAWAAIPAVIILAVIVLLGWLRRRPRGEPGPPE